MDRRSFLGVATACVAVGCSTPPTAAPQLGQSPDRAGLQVAVRPRLAAADGTSVELDRLAGLVIRRDANGSTVSLSGGFGTGPEQLNGPEAVGLAPNGDCWVLDRGNRRLQRYDRAGQLVHTVPAEHATAFAVASTGALILAEAVPSRVRFLNAEGTELQAVELDAIPVDVAVRADGEVLVLTQARQVLALDGSGVLRVLVDGTQLTWPTGLGVDAEGRIVVADAGAFQLVTFQADGRAHDTTTLTLDDGRRAQPIRVQGDVAGVAVTVVAGEA